MVISDTLYTINVFTIGLLTAELGQVWAKLGLQKSHTTLGEITRLHNIDHLKLHKFDVKHIV